MGTPPRPGAVRLIKDLDEQIATRHVVLVEDIIDTGLTAAYLLRTLRRGATPPACVFARVRQNRTPHRGYPTDCVPRIRDSR